MKYLAIRNWFLPVLAFSSVIFISSCDKNNDNKPAAPTNTVDQIINSNPDLSLFKAAVTKAKLTSFTQGPGPFTFFIPNNAALNAIGINTEADINALDSNLLVTILTYHILAGNRPVVEIPVGPNAPITMQGGGVIYASKKGTDLYINGVKAVSTDVAASNGIIHILNRVLVPPTFNALLSLQANPNFKLFVQAINKAAVTANFTATGPITVFAPTNAAMTAAGYDSTAIANATAATLSPIMKYHVANIRRFSSELTDGQITMVQGTKTTISSSGTKIKGTTNVTPFNITAFDWVVTNGVIHTIDGMLKP
jgi:uncharacterized surface protein with fasciclin (FAS1) repeats